MQDVVWFDLKLWDIMWILSVFSVQFLSLYDSTEQSLMSLTTRDTDSTLNPLCAQYHCVKPAVFNLFHANNVLPRWRTSRGL